MKEGGEEREEEEGRRVRTSEDRVDFDVVYGTGFRSTGMSGVLEKINVMVDFYAVWDWGAVNRNYSFFSSNSLDLITWI